MFMFAAGPLEARATQGRSRFGIAGESGRPSRLPAAATLGDDFGRRQAAKNKARGTPHCVGGSNFDARPALDAA